MVLLVFRIIIKIWVQGPFKKKNDPSIYSALAIKATGLFSDILVLRDVLTLSD